MNVTNAWRLKTSRSSGRRSVSSYIICQSVLSWSSNPVFEGRTCRSVAFFVKHDQSRPCWQHEIPSRIRGVTFYVFQVTGRTGSTVSARWISTRIRVGRATGSRHDSRIICSIRTRITSHLSWSLSRRSRLIGRLKRDGYWNPTAFWTTKVEIRICRDRTRKRVVKIRIYYVPVNWFEQIINFERVMLVSCSMT